MILIRITFQCKSILGHAFRLRIESCVLFGGQNCFKAHCGEKRIVEFEAVDGAAPILSDDWGRLDS